MKIVWAAARSYRAIEKPIVHGTAEYRTRNFDFRFPKDSVFYVRNSKFLVRYSLFVSSYQFCLYQYNPIIPAFVIFIRPRATFHGHFFG